tara:strand:- start:2070 stop:2468 length:399 start_codon:yes stop_codon:yes gene_type:complete
MNDFPTAYNEDGSVYDEWDHFIIEIRSPSKRDLMGLMDSFYDQCGGQPIEEDPHSDMSSFRFKIQVDPEDWVNLIARLGAGLTYKSFMQEIDDAFRDGCVESGAVTFLSSLRVMVMQIYSKFHSPPDLKVMH